MFAFSGGTGSVLPKFGASITRTNTVTTTIDATIGLHYRDTAVCGAIPARVRAGLGFEKWLSRSIEQLNVQAKFSPYGVVDSLQLKANFGVVKSGNAGATFDFVFLGGDVSAMQSRNDVQTIQITLQPPGDKVKYPTVVVDGVSYGPPKGKPSKAKLGPLKTPPKKVENKRIETPPSPQPPKKGCSTPHGLGCFDVAPQTE
ncbi:trypco2 family protein [Mesorhizobium sp. M0220]|uniref:trypco2 family protein n=1 Tax=unclassified Mesorhizobium TaxID=325217 RepID=UPI00333A7D72